MSEDRPAAFDRHTAAIVAGVLVAVGAVVAVIVWDPIVVLVIEPLRGVDLPFGVELPEQPGWLPVSLGKIKLLALAVVVVLAALGEVDRRRKRGAEGSPDADA